MIKDVSSPATLADTMFQTFLFYFGEWWLLSCPLLVLSQLFQRLVATWRSSQLDMSELEQRLLAATTDNKEPVFYHTGTKPYFGQLSRCGLDICYA